MSRFMNLFPAEDVWLEGGDAPPSLALRAAAVALVLCCTFAVFFFIGHATAGGPADAEQPVGTVLGASEANVPGRLSGVAALGALEAPRPVIAPTPAPRPREGAGQRAGESASEAPASAPESESAGPAEAPPAAQPAPEPSPAPSHHSGGHPSGSGGGSFDSSG